MNFKKRFFVKLFSLGVFAVSNLGFVSAAENQMLFPDVKATSPQFTSINYLSGKGVLLGYEDGTFKPNNGINRAELMKILVAGQGIYPDEYQYMECFSDVKDEWFAPYVCYAKEMGWVSGNPDGTFAPAKNVNRAEGSKMVLNSLGITAEGGSGLGLSDVNSTDWYKEFAQTLAVKNLLNLNKNLFEPAKNLTRGEIAELTYRSLVLKQTKEKVFNQNIKFDSRMPISLIVNKGDYQIESEVMVDEVKKYDLAIYKPVINDPVFNEFVEKVLLSHVEGFMENVNDGFCEQTPGRCTLEIYPEFHGLKDQVLSVLFNVYTYTGGAHPDTSYSSVNFDLNTSELLGIDTIFIQDEKLQKAALNAIAIEAKTQLSSKLEDSLFEEGVTEDWANFATFTLDKNEFGERYITFWFEPYMVGPYAAGPQQVSMLFTEISDYLRKEYR